MNSLYWPGDSFLHGMDAKLKIVVFVAICSGLAFVPYFFSLLLILLGLILIGKASRLPAQLLFAGILAFVWIGVFVAGATAFSRSGLNRPASFFMLAIRLLAFLVAANLFALTTSPLQVGHALRDLFGGKFSFVATLAFRFFPLLREERLKIERGQILRGAPLDSPNFFKRFRAYPALLIPLFILTFRKAEQIATAMLLRSFSPEFRGKFFRRKRSQTKDIVAFSAALFMLAFFFFIPRFLPPVFRYPVP